jgi:hypothetical protein
MAYRTQLETLSVPGIVEISQLLYVLMLASFGAAVGGAFKHWWAGAAIGGWAIACLLWIGWLISRVTEWLSG